MTDQTIIGAHAIGAPRRHSFWHFLAGGILAIALSGCGTFREIVVVEPNANLSALRSFYVVEFPAEKRNMHNLIKDQLVQSGRIATAGAEGAAPTDIDAFVTYRTIWWRDLSYYLLELHITIRDPKTKYPLATGVIVRPGTSRISSAAMAKEVLTNIFKGKSYDSN